MDAHLQTDLPSDHPHRHPHPSKEDVRAWLVRRGHTAAPPPAPDEIRRELGWSLAPSRDPAGCLPVFFPVLCTGVFPLVLTEWAALTAFAWYCLAWQASAENGPAIT